MLFSRIYKISLVICSRIDCQPIARLNSDCNYESDEEKEEVKKTTTKYMYETTKTTIEGTRNNY